MGDAGGPRGRFDLAKVLGTTQAEILTHMIEDGDDPEDPFAGHRVVRPRPARPSPSPPRRRGPGTLRRIR